MLRVVRSIALVVAGILLVRLAGDAQTLGARVALLAASCAVFALTANEKDPLGRVDRDGLHARVVFGETSIAWIEAATGLRFD